MTKTEVYRREQLVAAAIGSVKAEGLQPTKQTQKDLKAYARGKVSLDDLRTKTLRDIKAKTSPTR